MEERTGIRVPGAPGASAAEVAVAYGVAVLGALTGIGVGLLHDAGVLLVVVLALVGFDLFGGAVVNALPSASARFHGPSGTAARRVRFVALHVHLPLLVLLVPGLTWGTAVTLYLVQLGTAGLIEAVGDGLRRPVAFAGAVTITTLAVAVLAVPPVVGWLAPVLAVKLLLGHLLRA